MTRPALIVLATNLTVWTGAAGAVDASETARRIVEQTNAFRAEQSRAQLKANAELQASAATFAQYMAKTGRHSHTADGRTPVQRATAAGYAYCIVTENIGYFASSREPTATVLAERLMRGWKESPGHRANLVDADVLDIGVGVASDGRGKYYAVQMFGRPRSAAQRFSIVNPSGDSLKYRIGTQEHLVEPRTVRTHETCRPAEVHVEPPGRLERD